MKKSSKILSLVLAVAMLLTCLPMTMVFADEKKLEDYPETVVLLNADNEKEIKGLGLTPETANTNERKFSGKWAFTEKGKVKESVSLKKVTDISAYETLEFYLCGDAEHATFLKLYISAENPGSSGMDYYDGGEFEVLPGWNKYTFSISKMSTNKVREPLPLTSVGGIVLHATGWGLSDKNDVANTVIYLDNVILKRGDKIITGNASAPTVSVEKQPETEAGTAKYFEYGFEEDKLDDVTGPAFAKKTQLMEIVKDADSKKSYLKIEKLGTDSDCHMDISFKNSGRYTVLQADYMTTKIAPANLISVKDTAGKQSVFVALAADGTIKAGNQKVGTAKVGEWFNIAVCADMDSHCYDVYLNEKLVLDDVPITNTEMGYLSLVRVLVGDKVDAGLNICVDNIRAYDGKTPADYEKAVDKPGENVKKIDVNSDASPNVIIVKEDQVADVKNAVCLKINCPTALVRHKKVYIDESNKSVAPMIVNSRTLVPVRFIAEAFGAEVLWDDATRTVTVKKDNDTLELVIGTNIIKKNGTDITIDVPAAIYNDRTMLPLRAVTENLGKKVFWDDMGLIIIDDKEYNYTKEKDLSKMVDIMQSFIYERPSREQIKADIVKNTPNHPRLYVTKADFDRIKEYATVDVEFQKWIEKFSNNADKYVLAAQNNTEAKPFLYGQDVGGRLVDPTAITSKAPALGLMYQLTGDMKYVDAMWYTLEDVCDREKWPHWGAGHFLNASAVMEAVAIAYDWMYDAWTPEQKAIIEEALYDCGIEDSITSYYGASDHLMPPMGVGNRSGWTTWNSNWNSVCNGGVMAAGAAMATHEKYGDLAVKAMKFASLSNEIGLRCYAPDGGYPEGIGYWDYGTGGAMKVMYALQSATGNKTAYGLTLSPGLELTWEVPVFSESKLGIFNFGDASIARSSTNLVMWFGRVYNRPDAVALRYNEITTGEKAPSIWDILNYRTENAGGAQTLPLDSSFFDSATFMTRSSWTDTNQLFAAIHGGYNSAGHADNDSGTFVLDSDGQRWFIELGADYYNLKGYFSIGVQSGGRWQYYSKRAEGQNVFVINPVEGPVANQLVTSRCYLTKEVSKPRGSYAILDLTPAYSHNAEKAERGIMLAANRKAFVIQDEIKMLKPSEYYWFAHTKADIEIAEDGRSALMKQGGKELFVELVSDNADLKFEVMDAVGLPTSPAPNPQEYSREGIRKLVVHAANVENINMAVVCTPVHGGEKSEYKYTMTKLADWNIPDGDILVPKLEGISVNGAAVNGFNSDITHYEVVLPYGTTQVPEIAATPDAVSNYEIKVMPESLPGTAVIKVTNKEDRTMFSTYTVFVRAASDVEIEVSDAQEGNPGSQCLDKKLETRWAVEGEGWGIFHFANPKEVSIVKIATWKAATRQLIFDIEVSEDGENFKQVWSGKTAAKEDVLEDIAIPKGTYKAIKLVLHGTTTGAWNSILEVEFE